MKFSELQRLQRREGITVISSDARIEQLEARLCTITKERDALRAKVEAMEKQEPYAFAVAFPESSRVELVHDLDDLYEDLIYEAHVVRKLYLAPGAKGE